MKHLLLASLVLLTMMVFLAAVASGGYVLEWELPGTANWLQLPDEHLQDYSGYDCDGNGILEIIVLDNSNWPDSYVLTAYDGLSHQSAWMYASNYEPHYLGAYDFDSDGLREIVVREYDHNQDDNYIKIIHWSTSIVELTIHDVSNPVICDIDRDSRPEVVLESGGGIQVWGFQQGASSVDDHAAIGGRAGILEGNIPNPFNGGTIVGYRVNAAGFVSLDIYDVSGKHVKSLVSAARDPGSYEERWDGRDDQGRQVASGIYHYRLVVGGNQSAREMILLK